MVLKCLKKQPKKLFLIDAIGAFITSTLLFAVLAQFSEIFGMPISVLYFLAGVAFCFFLYSLICYAFVKTSWKLCLKIIIVFNSLYAFLSVYFITLYFHDLTFLGLLYFSAEIIIIKLLIILEIKTIRHS